jgi:3-mercaptopyruvate sulfurtransferase SseA
VAPPTPAVTPRPAATAPSRPDQPAVAAPTPIQPATLTVQEVKALLDGPSKPFVFDARSKPLYDAEHVPGAVSIPLDDLAGRMSEVPRDRLVVAYCSGAT